MSEPRRTLSLLALFVLTGLSLDGRTLLGQDAKVVRVDIETRGSVPPVREWYGCSRKLDGQASFDATQGRRCLKDILNHRKYFRSGRIKITPSKFDLELVTFVLESPTLKLTDIDYGIREELKSEFQNYVARNNEFPGVGDDYDYLDEGGNASRIGNFFESKGIMVGVARRVTLDYRSGTASLNYRIWEGPDGPVRPLLTDCNTDTRITYFSLIDLDDFTPRNLVLKSTHTRDGECFSEPAIRADEKTLKRMEIFSDVNYVEGNGNGSGRGVSLHIRTNPITVSEVSVKGFGLISTGDIQKESSTVAELPLKTSQRYRQSDAEASRKLLEQHFKTKLTSARVFEDDEVLPNQTIKVTYQVLNWPVDELYIDGQRFE